MSWRTPIESRFVAVVVLGRHAPSRIDDEQDVGVGALDSRPAASDRRVGGHEQQEQPHRRPTHDPSRVGAPCRNHTHAAIAATTHAATNTGTGTRGSNVIVSGPIRRRTGRRGRRSRRRSRPSAGRRRPLPEGRRGDSPPSGRSRRRRRRWSNARRSRRTPLQSTMPRRAVRPRSRSVMRSAAAIAYMRISASRTSAAAAGSCRIGSPARALSVANTIDRDRPRSPASKRIAHDAKPSPMSDVPPSSVPSTNERLRCPSDLAASSSVASMNSASSVSGNTVIAEPLKIVSPIRSPRSPAASSANSLSTMASSSFIEVETSRQSITSRLRTSRSSSRSVTGRIVSPTAASPTIDRAATSPPSRR